MQGLVHLPHVYEYSAVPKVLVDTVKDVPLTVLVVKNLKEALIICQHVCVCYVFR